MQILYGPDNARKETRFYRDPGARHGGLELTKKFVFGNYEEEIDNEGNKRKLHYLYGGDGLFAIYEWKPVGELLNQKMYFIHKDYLGSYETVTDDNGQVVDKLSFDPWGRTRNPLNWTYEEFPLPHLFDRGFTGHEHLDEFNLINMNGRVYDQWLGRFLSPDPFVQAPGYSQNYNRYSYAWNNPLKYVDPSGYYTYPKEDPFSGKSENEMKMDWINGFDFGSGFSGGGGSYIGNPYLRMFGQSTSHFFNKSRGANYGIITYRNGGYVNTWTGGSVSYEHVHNTIVLPNAEQIHPWNFPLAAAMFNAKHGKTRYLTDPSFMFKGNNSNGSGNDNLLAFAGVDDPPSKDKFTPNFHNPFDPDFYGKAAYDAYEKGYSVGYLRGLDGDKLGFTLSRAVLNMRFVNEYNEPNVIDGLPSRTPYNDGLNHGFSDGFNIYLDSQLTPPHPQIRNFGSKTLWKMFKLIWNGAVTGYNHPDYYYE